MSFASHNPRGRAAGAERGTALSDRWHSRGVALGRERTSAPPISAAVPAVAWKQRRVGRALSFGGLVFALALTLHTTILTGFRRIRTSEIGATNRVMRGEIDARIVITGSSRAQVHYDPRILGDVTGLKTYNLGQNAAHSDLQLAMLKTYLRHNPAPRVLVHNLDLHSFVTSHEIYDPARYLPHLHEEAIYAVVSRAYPDVWKWKYLPLYGYAVPDNRFTWMRGLLRVAGIESEEDTFDGFAPRALSWNEDFANFRQTHPAGIHTSVERQGMRDLEELVTVAQSAGATVIFVYSPEFVAIQPWETNRRVIFDHFKRLAERHAVPLWDFSDSEISHRRAYFYNSQHLNHDGARAFSLDLAGRLRKSGFSTIALRAENPSASPTDEL